MAKTNELQKHTLNLFPGGFEKLQDMYPDLGASVVIRRIVRNFIQSAEPADASVALEDVKL